MSHLGSSFTADQFVDTVGDVLLMVDAGTQSIVAASGNSQLLAGSPERLLGLGLAYAFSAEVAQDVTRRIEDIKNGKRADRLKARLRRLDGEQANVELHIGPTAKEDLFAVVVRATGSSDAELERAHRLLDAIVENIPTPLFVKDARSLQFVRVNRKNEELCGFKREQFLDKTDHDLFPKEQADHFTAKDREVLKERRLVDVEEEPLRTKEGGLRWLHTKKVPILAEDGTPLYLLGISEDITARKLAEARVLELSAKLASVIQAIPAAVITWTNEGTIESWNSGAEVLFGLPEEQAVGTSIDAFIPPAEKKTFAERQTRVLQDGQPKTSQVYWLRGGFQCEVEETLFAIPGEGGAPPRIGCIARDGAELVRLRRAAEIASTPDALFPNGRQGAMEQALATAAVVAEDGTSSVLLTGETGVGKGWLARHIHRQSPRAKSPFFEFNCASLPADVVENELFGYVCDDDPQEQRRGLIEAADGGTLLLSEIGDLPKQAQRRLLEFLDHKAFCRVGGSRKLTANVRVLAATSRDLREAVSSGEFVRELYYRLSIIPIHLPPLRDHLEDMPQLCQSILHQLSVTSGRQTPKELKRRALAALTRYRWPGNVRELRNVLERAWLVSPGKLIALDHLSLEVADAKPGQDAVNATLEEVERQHIQRVLESVNGNRTHAAEILGISRSTLKRKLAALADS